MCPIPGQPQAKRSTDETAPTQMAPTQVAPSARPPEPAPFSRSVVIADDEESIAEAVAMLIEEAGFTPLVAPNGKVALELARTHRPALVITDLMMPIMDGAALIATLRAEAHADGAHPPPILLLSAAPASVATNAHADAYLSKPFDLGALEECIARLLDPA